MTKISRRRILQSAMIGSTVAAASRVFPNQLVTTPRVDSHLHCFAGPADSRFPYHDRAPYQPEKPATPEQLLDCLKTAGVDYAIVVPPEPYQDDHRYLEHCLNVGKSKVKGTLLLFADREGSL